MFNNNLYIIGMFKQNRLSNPKCRSLPPELYHWKPNDWLRWLSKARQSLECEKESPNTPNLFLERPFIFGPSNLSLFSECQVIKDQNKGIKTQMPVGAYKLRPKGVLSNYLNLEGKYLLPRGLSILFQISEKRPPLLAKMLYADE